MSEKKRIIEAYEETVSEFIDFGKGPKMLKAAIQKEMEGEVVTAVKDIIRDVKQIVKLEFENRKIKRGFKNIERELNILTDMLIKEKEKQKKMK